MALKTDQEQRFRITPHLAFLIKWLRVLGADVTLWGKKTILDPQREILVQWERYPVAARQSPFQVATLSGETLPELLQSFFASTGFTPGPDTLFTRCLRCNTLLVPLTPDQAKASDPQLPNYVQRTQKRFNWCPTCRQLYWAGTHVARMIQRLGDWGVEIRREPD